MLKLAGKTAIITGGNSGIGLATAHAFVREGARVILFGRSRQTLDAAVDSLEGKAISVQGDVKNMADLDRLHQVARDNFGGLDILFVNAGIAQAAPLEATLEELFDEVMGINFKGAYFSIQKVLPLLNDNASIVLNTSGTHVMGIPTISVYSASKAALRSLARTLSAELVGRGIRVNAISPGPVETPIHHRFNLPKAEAEKLGSLLKERISMQRFGKPEEIANAVVFLASSDASFVLGAELDVDGGFTQL